MNNGKTERKTRTRRWGVRRMSWGVWTLTRDGEVVAEAVEPDAPGAERLVRLIADALEKAEETPASQGEKL